MRRANELTLVTIGDPFDPLGSRQIERVPWRGQRIAALSTVGLGPSVLAWRNEAKVEGGAWLMPTSPGDVVTFCRLPEGETVGAFLVQALIATLVGGAVSFVAQLLFAPPGQASKPDDEESATYGWSGIRSTYRASGQAIPFLIGEHRVGGPVVGRYVESALEFDGTGAITGANETLRILQVISRGPIDSIGGYATDQDDLQAGALPARMEINGNAAENYSGVKCSLRLGGNNQSAIPGFEATRVLNPVGLLLDNETAASGNPAVTDWSNAAAYDMDVAADESIVGIEFPDGLYSLSGASLVSEEVEIEVRYIELVGGSPSGSYVTPAFFKDGQPNPVTIKGKVQGRFVYPLPLTHFDPATFSATSAGDAVYCDTGHLSVGDLIGTTTSVANSSEIVQGFSVEVFFKYQQGVASGTGSTRGLFSWIRPNGTTLTGGSYDVGTSGTLQGLSVKLLDQNPSGSTDDVQFEIEGGFGSSVGAAGEGEPNGWFRFVTPIAYSVSGGAQHFGQMVLTYWLDGNIARLRLHHNGALLFSKDTNVIFGGFAPGDMTRVRTPSNSFPVRFGNAEDLTPGGVIVDSCRVWRRAITGGEVTTHWNGGTPTAITGQSGANVVALWTMNEADGSGFVGSGSTVDPWTAGAFTDQHANASDLDITGTSVEKVVGFVYDTFDIGTPKAATYRIEAQRRDLVQEDTDTRDKAILGRVTTVEDEAFIYPGVALIGVEIPADDQLNTSEPNVTVVAKGYKFPVPVDVTDPDNPVLLTQWTATPAYVIAGMLSNPEWGPGKDVDWVEFKAWGDVNEALVYDQRDPADVLSLHYGTFPVGSQLETDYPDGYLEIRLDITAPATIPDHYIVGKTIELVRETVGVGAPSWGQDIIDVASYDIVEGPLETTAPTDTVRVPWPSSVVAVPPSPTDWVMSSTSSACEMEGREQRHRVDMVMDRRTEKFWPQLLKVANAGSGFPYRRGDVYGAVPQTITTPTASFSMANIIEGSFRLASRSRQEEFNVGMVEILDSDTNWVRRPVELQHSSLEDGTSTLQKVRRRSFTAEGITRRSHAFRMLRQMLNINFLARTTIRFDAEVDAILVNAGDVFYFTHDTPLWAYSGRLRTGSTTTELVIDRTITLDAAKTYRAVVRDDSTGSVEEVAVTEPAGTYSPGASITVGALSFVPAEDAPWIIGAEATATKLYRVVETTLTKDLTRRITAVEYTDDFFDETGFPALPPPQTELSVPDTEAPPAPLLSSSVLDMSGPDPDGGGLIKALAVSWQTDANQEAVVDGFAIWIREAPTDGSSEGFPECVTTQPASARTVVVTHPSLRLGTMYRVQVQPIARNGSRVPLSQIAGQLVRILGRPKKNDAAITTEVVPVGRDVNYRTTADDATAGVYIEIRRGGWFLGDRVATLPAGGETGPIGNWTDLPTANDGRKDVPLIARALYPSGAYGNAYDVTPAFDEDALSASVYDLNVEDDGWANGTITDFTVDSSRFDHPDFLRFDGSALSALYETKDVDLGAPGFFHVSFGAEVEQINPGTWDEYPDLPSSGPSWGSGAIGAVPATHAGIHPDAWGSEDGENDTWEGFLDRTDPQAVPGQLPGVTARYTWGRSETGTPPSAASDIVTFEAGVYYLRSFKCRLVCQRPSTDWDAHVTRMAIRVRESSADDISIPRGTAFPASAPDGFVFFRTDLDEAFYYDSGRAKWLSVRSYTYHFGSTSTLTNVYWPQAMNGATSSSTIGWKMPEDMTLVGHEARCGASVTANARIRKNGTNFAIISLVSAQYSESSSQNADIDQGDILGALAQGTWTNGGTVVLHFRRRAT